MNSAEVAALGVARLGMPIPMGKLVTIQAIAEALDNDLTSADYTEALIEWVSTRELESECLEALCPLLISRKNDQLLSRIRHALPKPSIASDLIISMVSGVPALFNSWSGCHSGPVPELLSLDKEEQDLLSITTIPSIFKSNLEQLEMRTNFPLIRQWFHEFGQLKRRCSDRSDGHLSYFIGSDRGNSAFLVPYNSQLARSAYLRVLACAVQHWGMPTDMAYACAADAFPIDPAFLKLKPQTAPDWYEGLQKKCAEVDKEPQELVQRVLETIECSQNRRIMHCSIPLSASSTKRVDLEIYSVLNKGIEYSASSVLTFYNFMIGRYTPILDEINAIKAPEHDLRSSTELDFIPILLPLVGKKVGYLQLHFLSRVSYMPVSTKSLPSLKLVPQGGSVPMFAESKQVGEFCWWLWGWKPSQIPGANAPIGSCLTMKPETIELIKSDLKGRIEYVWRIQEFSREYDYGEWSESEKTGILAVPSE